MVVRQVVSFTQGVVNAWNCLPGKIVAAKTGDMFKLELDRYLEALEIEGYMDIGKTGNQLECDWVIVFMHCDCDVCERVIKK